MELEAKAQYNYLKDTGVLQELIKDMTGDWAKDKPAFLEHYQLNQELL